MIEDIIVIEGKDEGEERRLFAALREGFDWALTVAAVLARDFTEELAAINRVREFMHDRLSGHSSSVSIDDVLFTIGLVISAIEREIIRIVANGADAGTGPAMHFPAAPERAPRIPRLVISRQDSSHGASTQLAA